MLNPNWLSPTPEAGNDRVLFLTTKPPRTIDAGDLISVSGLVFEDANRNGRFDEGEPALKGVTVNVAMPYDAASQVAAMAVTDDRGTFKLDVPRYALISINVPDGFRPVGPVTHFAGEQLVFGLRTDVMTVERVVQVVAPPAPLPTELVWFGGGLAILVISAALLLLRYARTQARALRELAEWQAVFHTPRYLPISAHGEASESWKPVIEQALAEAWGTALQADAFLGMACLPNAWMRFLMKDGRVFTFVLCVAEMSLVSLGNQRVLQVAQHPVTATELRQVFEGFARVLSQPAMLPRRCDWVVVADECLALPGDVTLPKCLQPASRV